MISTFLTFRVYAQDIPKTLTRIAADPQIARETKYYKENIDKVKSVDDLLDNSRLYNYAMKAAGLDDMIYAKAFMRKVLESDLTDRNSFANKLVDTRYVEFAKAFNFGADGEVKTSPPRSQAEYQLDDTVELYSEHRARSGIAAASETQYYQNNIGQVASVDDFLANDRLFAYALTANGIDATYASKSKLREVLVSDLSDPDSTANTLGAKYAALAASFNFEADGSIADGNEAQSTATVKQTQFKYYDNSGNKATPAAAALRADYYREKMPTITNVDELINDPMLFDIAVTGAGLDSTLQGLDVIKQVLTSDLSDPDSVANVKGGSYLALAQAFNFNTDGSINGTVQSAEQQNDTLDGYFVHQDDKAEFLENFLTTNYKSRVNVLTSVDGILRDESLYNYVLTAFDLDPTVESKSFIRQVLTSDLNDPGSVANRPSDKKYRELAEAFNFSADGKVAMPRVAQADGAKQDTLQLYDSRIGTGPTEIANAKKEATYYSEAIGNVQSLDDFINDKRLVAFVVKAYDLEDEQITNDLLRKVLTSDPFDERSFANKQSNTGFRDLAAAFNFTADGKIDRAPREQVQTRGDIIKTADNYLRQAMELRAGEENDGVRLALYFQRKAPVVDSTLDILADKALYEVVRTALGLPDTVAQASLEVQAKTIEKRMKIADLQDPKQLDKFLTQFSAMYDIKTGSSTPSIASLFGSIS